MPELEGKVRAFAKGDPKAVAWLADIAKKTGDLFTKVSLCDEFGEPRSKMEMLDLIGQWQLQISRAQADVGGGAPMEDDVEAAAEVSRLEALISGYKAEETKLLAYARSCFSDEQESWFGMASAMFTTTEQVSGTFTHLRELDESWVRQIKVLRFAYAAAGPEDGWIVSQMPGDPRLAVEPNAAEQDRLWQVYISQNADFQIAGSPGASPAVAVRDY